MDLGFEIGYKYGGKYTEFTTESGLTFVLRITDHTHSSRHTDADKLFLSVVINDNDPTANKFGIYNDSDDTLQIDEDTDLEDAIAMIDARIKSIVDAVEFTVEGNKFTSIVKGNEVVKFYNSVYDIFSDDED
jgi:hypothetical protein